MPDGAFKSVARISSFCFGLRARIAVTALISKLGQRNPLRSRDSRAWLSAWDKVFPPGLFVIGRVHLPKFLVANISRGF